MSRNPNISLQDYPYWDIKPQVKRYYLMQFAYWWQQLIVLVLGLEKPRKDYAELVAHHFVTLWLVGYVHNKADRYWRILTTFQLELLDQLHSYRCFCLR